MSRRTLAVAALVAAPILPLTLAATPAHAQEPPGVVTAPKPAPKAKPHGKAKPHKPALTPAQRARLHRLHVLHLRHLRTLANLRAAKVKRAQPGGQRAKLLRVAASYKGVPYVYGGASRRGVDCSGFVGRVYLEAIHKKLPRTVKELRRAARITRKPQPGDILFYASGRHVALVAKVSRGRVTLTWVARHTGTSVQTQKPYAAYVVGAVI